MMPFLLLLKLYLIVRTQNSTHTRLAFVGSFLTPVPIAKDSGDESVVQRLSIIALNILGEMSYLRHLSQKKS